MTGWLSLYVDPNGDLSMDSPPLEGSWNKLQHCPAKDLQEDVVDSGVVVLYSCSATHTKMWPLWKSH